MDKQDFLNQYGKQLNRQQLEAVCSVEGPLLLLAVPGSGKTTVLVTRLGYMIHCCNIPVNKILTLTYTVAATSDMEKRYIHIFGQDGGPIPEFRTINGICSKIITRYGQLIGKKAFELVTDEKQVTALVANAYRKVVSEYPTESDIKAVRALITYIKNRMLTPEELEKLQKKEKLPIREIYEEYCKSLRASSLMDYDDQLVYAYRMLKTTPALLAYYQEQYSYICVDEAQDTSKIQHAIIKLLAGEKGNLFMVGDEDQSIYGFRAAYPEALLSFEQDYRGGKVLLMEKNYRSGSRIVEKADGFIQKNQLRHPKKMIPVTEREGKVQIITLENRIKQYEYLAELAADCDRQTAVLYRDNESALPLIDLLERRRIPYRIRNAELVFFSHRIVTDVKNILRFALNPYDTELFMQIYYKLSTYLKKTDAYKACEYSEMEKIPVLEAVQDCPGIHQNTRKSCRALQTQFRDLLDAGPRVAIRRIHRFMGYGEFLERSGLEDNKIFLLEMLAQEENTLASFLNRLEELAELIREKETDYRCPFLLSTIHSSKGLEYERVYLMDVRDGIFPEVARAVDSVMPEDDRKEYEEERRLFYVAMTRAKEELIAFKYKDKESSFVKELTPKQTAVVRKGKLPGTKKEFV